MHRALVAATLAAAFVGVIVLDQPAILAQSAPPASSSAAQLTPILGGKKFTPPVKGDASIDFTMAQRREGSGANATIVSKMQVKNTSNAPIARLKVVETWYDKDGNTIPGGEASVNGLLQPGEVQSLELRTPVNLKMTQSKLQFLHANGGIPKPHRVQKLDEAETAKEPAAKPAAATKPTPKKKK